MTAQIKNALAMTDVYKRQIADCGFTSPYEMVYRFGRTNFKLREHPVMDQLNWLCRKRAGYDLKE